MKDSICRCHNDGVVRVSVARRNLFSDPTRLIISVGGVAVAILLIIVLLAVYTGSLRQMSAYVDNVDADLWVAQAGSPDMLHSFSVVPESLVGELSKVEGVSDVWPLTSRTTLVDIGEKKNSLILVGYQPGGAGGPWKMSEGNSEPGPGGIVADKVTMKTNGLELGDTIEADGQQYEIVGVSEDTSIMVAQYAFVDIEQAKKALGPNRINFILVNVDDPAARDRIKDEIQAAHPQQTVFTQEQFSSNNAAVIREGILPVLAVVVVIAFIIGVAIVGLVVYSATLEKYREYGVLKAVGASGPTLYKIVLEQSLLSALLGYAVGAVASFGVARIVSRIVVQISVAFTWQHFASAFVAAIVMSVIASYVPARKINRIDPVIVFKA
ncbi:MAG: ABC transporter permease [Thermoleophilia bacterium]